MKLIDRIIYKRIDRIEDLDLEVRETAGTDPDLHGAIEENRALQALRADPGLPPDRAQVLSRVYREAEQMEEPRMSLLSTLFAGKRWYTQAGLAAGLLTVLFALAVFLPTDSSLKPPPAWAHSDGYMLNYNLGRVPTPLINAAIDLSGHYRNNAGGSGVYMSSSDKINVVTTHDLSAGQLAEIKAALELIGDGEIKLLFADDMGTLTVENMEGLTVLLSDPDKYQVEKTIARILKDGGEINLEGLEVFASTGELAGEIEMLVRKLPAGIELSGEDSDQQMTITLSRPDLDEVVAEALASAGKGLRMAQVSMDQLESVQLDSEALAGLKEARRSLAAIEVSGLVEKLKSEMSEEEVAEVLRAIAQARREIEGIDMEEFVVDLGDLELEGFEESMQALEEEMEVLTLELEALEIEKLDLDLEEIYSTVARDELKLALATIDEAAPGKMILKVGELDTIDLSEIDRAIENFKVVKYDDSGAPVRAITRIADGDLITSIYVGAEDDIALDELHLSLSKVYANVPDPEVMAGTYFYKPGSDEIVGSDGIAINVMGHFFQFPSQASAEEIKAELDLWLAEEHPGEEMDTMVRILDAGQNGAGKVVVVSGDQVACTAKIFKLTDGRIVVTSGEEIAGVQATTVVVQEDEETGERRIVVNGEEVEVLEVDDAGEQDK